MLRRVAQKRYFGASTRPFGATSRPGATFANASAGSSGRGRTNNVSCSPLHAVGEGFGGEGTSNNGGRPDRTGQNVHDGGENLRGSRTRRRSGVVFTA